jgi:hypothetical protein
MTVDELATFAISTVVRLSGLTGGDTMDFSVFGNSICLVACSSYFWNGLYLLMWQKELHSMRAVESTSY